MKMINSLGIVTVDDVVDVIREEATEDFLQMAGAGKDREILLKSKLGKCPCSITLAFCKLDRWYFRSKHYWHI